MSENKAEFINDDDIEPRLFTARGAARYLGISVRLLIELTAAGELPCYNLLDRRAYKREDLHRWIDRQIQSVKLRR